MSSRTTSPRAADGRNMVATVLLCASAMLAPPAVHSQPLSGDGYLFHRPFGSISFRGGYAQPNASSDVFAFAREELTLDRAAFGAFSFGADAGFRVAERLSLQFNVSIAKRSADSEMRKWIGTDDLPIEQTTQLVRVPVMAGLRFDLAKPGRSIGRLAYIPSRITPYVAAGAGVMWYKFRQVGSFVDYQPPNDVFEDDLEARGTTAAGYGAFGADFSVRPNFAITTEGRYDAARASLNSSSFSGFNKIDLSGFSATVGLTFRY